MYGGVGRMYEDVGRSRLSRVYYFLFGQVLGLHTFLALSNSRNNKTESLKVSIGLHSSPYETLIWFRRPSPFL